MPEGILKIAFLIGKDGAGTARVIDAVCRLPHVQPVAVLLDTGITSGKQRRRNLRRNIRREGVSYMFHRVLSAVRQKLEDRADSIIPQAEVSELLDRVFPDDNLYLLAQKYRFPVIEAGNLNGETAIGLLKEAGADLGIVLGTRILKRPLFSVPRLGCINLHKGKVPDYRGMPPGFWELYDGRDSAGVTVHFVDDGMDTGDILTTAEVPIHPLETPESLCTKLDEEGCRALVAAVQQLQQGNAVRRPQPASNHKAYTKPTRVQTLELARRLPHWRTKRDGPQIVKLAVWLLLFHSGISALVRRMRKGKSRGAILLYHRVNDISQDVLTASTRRFAEHLVTLRRYYQPMATAEMVERIAGGKPIEPTAVAIHFDDCYRDVRTCAAPLLAAADTPAVAFVSSGFVDTERAFQHDLDQYPQQFENLTSGQVRELPTLGVAVAAHTINHVDLGTVSLSQAETEVLDSRRQLEEIIGEPVLLFSFPFGKPENIREEVRQMVVQAGYRALFSAHGGFIDQDTQLFDIPRFGVSSDHSPLALMMELEGISMANLRFRMKKRTRTQGPAAA